jgi:hypothetical protein
LKPVREKKQITYKGKPIKIRADDESNKTMRGQAVPNHRRKKDKEL